METEVNTQASNVKLLKIITNLKLKNKVLQKDNKKIKTLEKANEKLKFENENLQFQLKQAIEKLYGTSNKDQVPDEENKFDEPEVDENKKDEIEAADEEITIPAHKRKKRGRKPLPKFLDREIVEHDLPDNEKVCSCGEQLTNIKGEDSEQLKYIPAKVVVIVNRRKKYVCKKCEETVKLAPLPKMPIPKSIATSSLLATVLTAKFVDHLPLYRQEQIWQRLGVDIPRQTMCNWTFKCADLLEPIVLAMKKIIKNSNYVRADETTVQVLKEKDRKTQNKSYMWVFMTGSKTNNHIVFEYHPTRAAEAANNFFEEFQGYLQTDGFSGYNALRGKDKIKSLGCLAHARRKFVDITKNFKHKSGKAYEALKYIKALYKIEREAKELNFDERYKYRLEHAVPIFENFKKWLDQSIEQVLPKTPIGKAVTYAYNQFESLKVYLEDGRLDIDNNWCENQIRPFTLGRKNWLFMGNERGANASSIIYSLVITAKANKLDPWKYLEDVLTRTPCCKTSDDFAKLVPREGYFGNG